VIGAGHVRQIASGQLMRSPAEHFYRGRSLVFGNSGTMPRRLYSRRLAAGPRLWTAYAFRPLPEDGSHFAHDVSTDGINAWRLLKHAPAEMTA
jgi:hypothetical protein